MVLWLNLGSPLLPRLFSQRPLKLPRPMTQQHAETTWNHQIELWMMKGLHTHFTRNCTCVTSQLKLAACSAYGSRLAPENLLATQSHDDAASTCRSRWDGRWDLGQEDCQSPSGKAKGTLCTAEDYRWAWSWSWQRLDLGGSAADDARWRGDAETFGGWSVYGEPFFEMRKVQLALSCVRSDDLLETVNDPSALLPLFRQQSLRLMPKSLEQTYQQMGAAAVPPQPASVLECCRPAGTRIGWTQPGGTKGGKSSNGDSGSWSPSCSCGEIGPAPAVSPAPARRYIGEPGSCEICGSCGELATWEGQGLMDPAALAVEEIRKRVMQERCRSCRRLQKRPSRIRQPQVAWMGDRPWVPTGGWVWVPEGGGQPSPQQGGRPPILHRLGFSLVILWEIRQHVRSQDHRWLSCRSCQLRVAKMHPSSGTGWQLCISSCAMWLEAPRSGGPRR